MLVLWNHILPAIPPLGWDSPAENVGGSPAYPPPYAGGMIDLKTKWWGNNPLPICLKSGWFRSLFYLPTIVRTSAITPGFFSFRGDGIPKSTPGIGSSNISLFSRSLSSSKIRL